MKAIATSISIRSKLRHLLFSVTIAVSPFVPSTIQAQDVGFAPDRLIVKYRDGTTAMRGAALREAVGSQVVRRLPIINADVVSLPEGWDVDAAVAWYRGQVGVEYAEPDYIFYAIEGIPSSASSRKGLANSSDVIAPDDPRYSEMWGLNNTGQTGGLEDADIDAPEAWNIITGSDTIIVGVIDSGIDTSHPDLAQNIWVNTGEIADDGIDNDGNGFIDDINGWDFYNDDASVYDGGDLDKHGTHVAGTIGAVSDNSVGVTGVAWNVQLMSLKFLQGSGSTSDAIDAIQYAVNNGAHLTTNSWGGGGASQALKDAIDASGEAGMLFIAASGNSAAFTDDNPMYPAAYTSENIVSVNSSDHNDERSGFSNYGLISTDMAAPGSNILSTLPGESYGSYSGTSMATPHVTGVAVLVYATFPELTHMQVKDRLMMSGDAIPALEGTSVSGRRLNANNALDNDSIPPSSVSDLAVVADEVTTSKITPFGGTALTLSWTAPGDDESEGSASTYDLRYATTPITDEAAFEAAMSATGEPFPKSSGTTQSTKVIGLDPESVYHFALKSLDNVGNSSALSNATDGETGQVTKLFSDGAESAASEDLWIVDMPWSRTSEFSSPEDATAPLGGSWSWTDSPGRHYTDNLDARLTSIAIDLSSVSNPVLQFDHRYDIESGWDFGTVEVSTNGFQWTELKKYTGTQETWTSASMTLNEYVGEPTFYVRFRLNTDWSVTYDGWYLDDIRVIADTDAVLTLSTALDASGDTVIARLGVENKEVISGLSYELSWGSTDNLTGNNPLSFHTSTVTDRVTEFGHSYEVNSDTDVVSGILSSTSGEGRIAAGNGPLIEYRFLVRDDILSTDAAFVRVTKTGSPSSGQLPTISIRAPLGLPSAVFSDASGNPMKTGLEGGASVELRDSILNADVDFSGTVDVADVVRMIDFYLGRTAATRFELIVADTYPDGLLDIVDIVRGINILLGRTIGKPTGIKSTLASFREPSGSVVDRGLEVVMQSSAGMVGSTSSNNSGSSLVAEIPTGVVGLELGVRHGPSQLSDVRLLLDEADFSLVKNIGSTGSSFIIYSADNSPLPEGSQPVLELDLNPATDASTVSGNDVYLSQVLGVDKYGVPVFPSVDPMLAVQELLGTPSLLPSQASQLDRRGNRDGLYNLGDLLSLMRRSGLFPVDAPHGVAR